MLSQPRVGRRRSTTPEHITDVAIELFTARGFADVSVDDVALAAGIARRTLFRYYASKNAILWGDFGTHLAHLQDLLDNVGPQVRLGEALRAALLAFNTFDACETARHRKRMRVILQSAELQDYSTVSAGIHTLRFGTRLREYRDTNYSTAGSNGAYTFSSIAAYNAKTPTQYAAAIINNPVARATLLDGALFFQDDWRVKPNLMIGIGARFESQNWIHDRADWAPRIALAWSPGRPSNSNAKAVIRVGYGWFYDRFSVANSLGSIGDAPWVIRAQHDNLINQQSYVVNNPTFYDPTAPAPASTLIAASTSVPSFHSVDPHFHAALDMQAGAGIDLQPAKNITFSVTYLYTQGVHQYFSNNVTAPAFNGSTYTVTGPPPPVFNYQFQSGGFYKQHQLIVTNSWQLRRFVLNGSYTFNQAMSDTQGVDQFVVLLAGDIHEPLIQAAHGSRQREGRLIAVAAKECIITIIAHQDGNRFGENLHSWVAG